MSTVVLLAFSNIFMTFAWYGHLKYGHDWPLWKAILVSWGIALIEYCLAVPANRFGFVEFSGFQLKIIQEVITLAVFMFFAILFLKEKLAWNYLVAFAFLGLGCALVIPTTFSRVGQMSLSNAGRSAASISLSGFAESSERQKAISSKIQAHNVRPLTVRNELLWIAMMMPFFKTISSLVNDAISFFSTSDLLRNASMYEYTVRD